MTEQSVPIWRYNIVEVCMYIYAYMYKYIHVYIYLCVCVYMYIYICMCVYCLLKETHLNIIMSAPIR